MKTTILTLVLLGSFSSFATEIEWDAYPDACTRAQDAYRNKVSEASQAGRELQDLKREQGISHEEYVGYIYPEDMNDGISDLIRKLQRLDRSSKELKVEMERVCQSDRSRDF